MSLEPAETITKLTKAKLPHLRRHLFLETPSNQIIKIVLVTYKGRKINENVYYVELH